MFAFSSPLRMLLLGLLIFGILAKPVLAIACELHDIQRSAAETSQDGAKATSQSGQEERCCSLPDCNDCCAHTTAMVPEFFIIPAGAMAASPLPSLSVKFEPAAVSVAFRPPIRT